MPFQLQYKNSTVYFTLKFHNTYNLSNKNKYLDSSVARRGLSAPGDTFMGSGTLGYACKSGFNESFKKLCIQNFFFNVGLRNVLKS